MKDRKSDKSLLKIILMMSLTLLMLPGAIWAAVGEKMETSISMASSPPAVIINPSQSAMDQAVFQALSIVVLDGNSNKIDFSQDEINLNYSRQVGTQRVDVTYKGNDQYLSSSASGGITITEVPRTETRVVLSANPPAVTYTGDSAQLDLSVYQSLGVVVVDAGNNPVGFTAADIELSYNRATGKQDVTVKYKGNNQFLPSLGTAFVEIKGNVDPPAPTKENTSVSLAKSPGLVEYQSDPGKLDAAVYAALEIKVVDSKNNPVNFTTTDIELSYNRVAGDQPVTVKYKGNEKFNYSMATQTVTIYEKDDCSLIINDYPGEVEYDDNDGNLDDAIYDDLELDLVDEDNNKIEYDRDDIELEYDREVGEQEVLVKYKGNNTYKSAVATVRVNIVKPPVTNPWVIAGVAAIFGAIIVVSGILGVVIYRKKRREKAALESKVIEELESNDGEELDNEETEEPKNEESGE
ncbi:hypothetical protein GH811_16255 [Acetobacterium malicum]|uniref:Uncharacterized protein n=1 Tax=Acetobacterium malicum TaxID=52692 RepID=A0ABR6Z0Y1_9FIRM|nr:hypothetical protein [Acetobacterium malicum]MBC3901166.1 hypothetical protein [Acetobacterium malicum]